MYFVCLCKVAVMFGTVEFSMFSFIALQVCKDLSQIVPVILVSPFTISYYTYKCWQITE